MDNGLRKSLNEVTVRATNFRQNRALRKGVYALGTLLGGSSYKEEEPFNGFKDELTDYSKFKKSKGITL